MKNRRRLRGTSSRKLIALLALLLAPSSVDVALPLLPFVSFPDFLSDRSRFYGIPEETVRGMIRTESSGRADVRGRHGEVGLLQLKLSTAREVIPDVTEEELTDPFVNVEAGLRYLAGLRREFGSLRTALIAYNRGPGRVRSDLANGRTLPGAYARRVQRFSKFKTYEQEKKVNKLSVIIPSYRNPAYLRLALSSLLSGRELPDTEIVVVIDGFREMYEDLMKEFSGKVRFVVLSRNAGMQNAINVGVSRAKNEFVLVTNEDVVAGRSWDTLIAPDLTEGLVLGIDCIEPRSGSLFGFPAHNAGETLAEFRAEEFHRVEFSLREDRLDSKSYIFPFAMHRADFMKVGGFDASNFSGPYLVDDDFFLRCQLARLDALRTLKVRFYHFSGKSTKHRDDEGRGGDLWGPTPDFFAIERNNVREFVAKWGFRPVRSLELNSVIAHGSVPNYLKGRVISI